MTSPRSSNQIDSVFGFERSLVRAVVSDTNNPTVVGWSVYTLEGPWHIELQLQSPEHHSGLVVGITKTVPDPASDLGMDLETYVLVQASGLVERFLTRQPGSDPYMRYVPQHGGI